MEEIIDKKNIVNDELINRMFESGAHYGYSRSRRHPSMASCIFGVKNKVEVFDLEKTKDALNKAKDFVRSLSVGGKKILFVGGKNEASSIIEDKASSINMPYMSGRWIGGTLTNFVEIKKRVDKYQRLIDEKEKGELTKYTKKERLLIDREMDDLKKNFSGLIQMIDIPSALFIVDPKKESIAVEEAKQLGLPIIALLNSDCDTKKVDFPIPANDASRASIELFTGEIVNAYKEVK